MHLVMGMFPRPKPIQVSDQYKTWSILYPLITEWIKHNTPQAYNIEFYNRFANVTLAHYCGRCHIYSYCSNQTVIEYGRTVHVETYFKKIFDSKLVFFV